MLKAISLFSGIGGLDFGFEAAGFETAVALEMDAHSCRALSANRPNWRVVEADINGVSSKDLLTQAGLRTRQADILIGGPPCQPFSKSGYWSRGDALRLDDPRANTLAGYLRVLRDSQPRTFLLENVAGLAFQGKDEGLRHLIDGIEYINRTTGSRYKVSWKAINCAEYGVPQTRERVFLIGSRDGREFKFPKPTHRDPGVPVNDLFDDLEPFRTAWDALGDLQPAVEELPSLAVGGKWGGLLPSIPEGQNYLWHTDRGGGLRLFGWRTRYWGFLLKLCKRRPAWTVQAQPGTAIGPFHWHSRKLSFRELSRIQTFPEGLSMPSGRTEMQRMLGNAVPSLIAEVLAREIRKQLLDSVKRGSLKLIPPKRLPVPPAERLRRVPKRYYSLIGEHKPHPGEGKGRMAVRRSADLSRDVGVQVESVTHSI